MAGHYSRGIVRSFPVAYMVSPETLCYLVPWNPPYPQWSMTGQSGPPCEKLVAQGWLAVVDYFGVLSLAVMALQGSRCMALLLKPAEDMCNPETVCKWGSENFQAPMTRRKGGVRVCGVANDDLRSTQVRSGQV